ncbi:Pentatricopeptide repeat-containing protein [Fusarium heterosporum]|uniref:Pentatricopeptide repeat-containing protein n=1 Tax=Fusarium heterosporum TaxID=42747 RepID=A0A8H5TQW8_FUSHE|nr:Pentatricopeptide repeat-containing protein [Fusarium heterosporum]
MAGTKTTSVAPTASETSTSEAPVSKSTNIDAPQSLDAEPEPVDQSVAAKKEAFKMERAVKKELQYLSNDPWKVSEYVKAALEKGKFEEAYLLVQKGSKDMQLVVPWNFLLNHLLETRQSTRAIKMFNEMKKRAQFPNASTYTILFRGLTKTQHPKTAVAEAVKHYNSLLKDPRLEPNITHLNAVLNVCNRANDLDSMFSILDTINDSTRAPTSYTYTTILNALRWNTTGDVKDLSQEQKDFNHNNTIKRGKAIWEEVISKWRKGRLIIDEELVCSMGRMLLMSPSKDEKKEILDLVEQTMNIPNLAKVQEVSAADARKKNPRTGEVVKKDGHGLYVTPGNNTLSLLLHVVHQTRTSSLGIKYWNFLVREYDLEPDMDCWLRLFGLLKLAKASAHATEILSIVPTEIINPRIYRIAMETCDRDNINQNVLKHANRALDSMVERLNIPDPLTMRIYLNVAQNHHFHLRARANDGDVAGAKRDYGIQITNALDRLWIPYRKLHDHLFKNATAKAKTGDEKATLYNEQREAIALARIMYGSFNKVLQQEMLPEEDLERIRPVGGRINREIQAFFAKREEAEPNLRKTEGRGRAGEEMSEYNEGTGSFWDTTQAGRPPRRREDFESRFDGRARGRGDDRPYVSKPRSNDNWRSNDRRNNDSRDNYSRNDDYRTDRRRPEHDKSGIPRYRADRRADIPWKAINTEQTHRRGTRDYGRRHS